MLEFRLAPLQTRRDIGMLGIIHRSVLGEGPEHFAKYFVRNVNGAQRDGREAARNHDKQLITHRKGKFRDLLSHSLLGLVDIYNLLPRFIVSAATVSDFQKRLQLLVIDAAANNHMGWQEIVSPRNTLWNNQLRKLHNWCPAAPAVKK